MDITINAKLKFIFWIILIIFLIYYISFYKIMVVDHKQYLDKYNKITKTVKSSTSPPRGYIYDKNHTLLVDNKVLKLITYTKKNKLSFQEEVDLARDMINHIELDYYKLTRRDMLDFYILDNKNIVEKLIKEDEIEKYNRRELTSEDIYNFKLERITDEMLSIYDDDMKKVIYLYSLMNKGYLYDTKVIKSSDITDMEFAYIAENKSNLMGFDTQIDSQRNYIYGNTLKSILGTVSDYDSGLPSELKSEFLEKGYSITDRVGTSYLEYQYNDYLFGEKEQYYIDTSGNYVVVNEGKKGDDVVLTIDIELQNKIEEIVIEELYKTKNEPNTKYFNKAFVVVTNPNTGEILSLVGKQIIEKDGEYNVYDFAVGTLTTPITPGSVVKGASISVGYKTGVIDIGTKLYDECLHIKSTPDKCSWKSMGLIDDLYALKWSSNVYQFKTAISVANSSYTPYGGLSLDLSAYNTYRTMFNDFGLGVKTGIDLPIESIGVVGNSKKPGLLLDFSIGQYDTYTALQLSQYINTIINNGDRLRPYIVSNIYEEGSNFTKEIFKNEKEVLNTVDLDIKYFERIKEGFINVVNGGTGNNYIDAAYKGAGKTGTADTFIDTDNDGLVDTETTSTAFVGYAPYDNPEISIVVLTPDISYNSAKSTYNSSVNKRIVQKITNFYFQNK